MPRFLFATFLAFAVFVSPANAQEKKETVTPAKPREAKLEEKQEKKEEKNIKATQLEAVSVTASKVERSAFDVPAAITIINKEDLERVQANKLDDALRQIPNVDSAGGPRRISQEPSIRGLSDRRIAIKVDGQRRNFRAQYGGRYFVDPDLIERIEVSRGANSTLDGSGAVGGSIQIVTKDARDMLKPGQNTGYSVGFGTRSNSSEFATSLAAYTKAQNFDGVAAVSYRNGGNYEAGGGREVTSSESQMDNSMVKASLIGDRGERVTLSGSIFRDDSRIPASPFQPQSVINAATRRDTEQKDLSLRYQFDNPDNDWLNMSAIVYHENTDVDSRRLTDNRFDETDHTTNGFDVYNTSEFKFASDSIGHSLTYGVEAYRDEQEGKRNGGPRPLLGNAQQTVMGLYVQDEIDFGNGLTLIPGVRYDRFITDPQSTTIRGQTNDSWSPKIAANYIVNDTVSVYGSLAKAFRNPTITELYADGVLFPGNSLVPNPNLQPETAINKEIGIRFRGNNWISGNDRYLSRVSVFQNDVDDYIEQVIGAATTQFRNVSQARIRGIEWEGEYETPAYIFNVGLSYLRGDNESANQPLVDVAPHKAFLQVIRKIPDQDMQIGWRMEAADAQDRIPSGQPLIVRTGGYAVHGVFLTWLPSDPALNDMRIDFGIDNIFDKNYRRQLSFIPEEGRDIKLRASWKF